MQPYQNKTKQNNKMSILELAMEIPKVSRVEISEKLGLTRATVSNLTEELIKDDLLTQVGQGKSSGGRKPAILSLNENAGYTIGIDIGVNYIYGILTDLKGTILSSRNFKYRSENKTENNSTLISIIDSFIYEMDKDTRYGLVGIGIGIPGILKQTGEIIRTPNINWLESNIKHNLESKYEVPVYMENEANAGALGELFFGKVKSIDDFIYISIGIGIGVGVIFDKNLFKGSTGFSGEVGHITIERDGIKCKCGNYGCWELYASESFIYKNFDSIYPDNKVFETTKDLILSINLAKNDEDAESVFKELGDNIGIGLATIINIFNPKKVIIGTRIDASLIENDIKKSAQKRALPELFEQTKIYVSNNKQVSTTLGLSGQLIRTFFKKVICI